jgi:hypothetical protein
MGNGLEVALNTTIVARPIVVMFEREHSPLLYHGEEIFHVIISPFIFPVDEVLYY